MVSTSDSPLTEGYENYHMVAFGRPTTNPMIAYLNDHMPQPFIDGEDSLQQQIGNAIYRLPENYSIGVIQAFSTPWNPLMGVTVVSGTTDEGVSWSINTYSDEDLVRDLDGDIVFIREDALEVINSSKAGSPDIETALEEVGEDDVILETVEPESPKATQVLVSELPERYQPEEQSPPIDMVIMYGLVGIGALVAIAGIILTIIRRPK